MTYDTLSGQKDLASQYNTAILHTTMGDITIRFFADASPKTVNNFLNLAQAGEYDGTKFHRVIKDFMIQGGDPLSKYESKQAMWGTGGPEYRFEDEFNDEPLVRGSLAMANAGPGTNGSQFFIVTAPETPWLDGKHTNFGYVVEGMDVVEKIENVQTVAGDRPVESVVIKSIELLT
ncbi:MAG: peptidylprolyl isomerase [Candidatus Magasanikbacteria bacterium CG11_big_fil_rev_8_21_14_0_20_43_7]|uniref:Peptidyl-prolyl cis-trans isomerase n=1 Tax=Candidatus Magasanikbacteria bacterium CG11_big_fil_rev_8_21_14_0_20_43_7 TaxID=1974654 RepID=A0A2H0N3E8_9BACT|nr:MAG: peptidylprolyl isomerase [Candidatus Magasanikbacteria bacterium CG11_big_fil_rev_8_21_14_0_20_43_7]